VTTPRDLIIEAAIDGVLEREAGFVDIPEDRGGATNRGITAATLGAWRKLGRPATAEEVQASTEDEARAIYRAQYVDQSGAGAFTHQPSFELVLDSAVQHGPRQAARFVQRAIGMTDDGMVGPFTRKAITATEGPRLYYRILAQRIRFLGRLITHDTTDADRDGVTDTAELAAGLLDRMAGFVERIT